MILNMLWRSYQSCYMSNSDFIFWCRVRVFCLRKIYPNIAAWIIDHVTFVSDYDHNHFDGWVYCRGDLNVRYRLQNRFSFLSIISLIERNIRFIELGKYMKYNFGSMMLINVTYRLINNNCFIISGWNTWGNYSIHRWSPSATIKTDTFIRCPGYAEKFCPANPSYIISDTRYGWYWINIFSTKVVRAPNSRVDN